MINIKRSKMIDIIEKECHHCGKKIYIQARCVREHIFCTLGCLSESEKRNNGILTENYI